MVKTVTEKDDWRLLNDVQHLTNQEIDPIDREDIIKYLPNLKHCQFCWGKVVDGKKDFWYLPLDKSCCICGNCFNDFKKLFKWKLLDGWDIEW